MEIVTDRLILRPFRDEDRAANAQIFADPQVRRFALGTLDARAANARIDRAMAEYHKRGFGMLAVEDRRDGALIGMLGLTGFTDALRAAIPSRPELQIAWQLARHAWGRGLATEGALAMLDHAFSALEATEVVAVTASINTPSRRVMVKSGMHHAPEDDFLHPDFPPGHSLRAHVLYRITRSRA
jgi:Acetyltransferases, including N-acetylases of ribosomal proteins